MFFVAGMEMEIDVLLKYPQNRFFYSQVEILCRLILRVKKFEDALLFLLSHRWHDFVVVECRENVRSFRCLAKAFFFLHGCSIRILRFLLPDNEISLLPTLMFFLFHSRGGNP